jgi:hypothetical protein
LKDADSVTGPCQLMIGCSRCGWTPALEALPLVCPSSKHNGRQKNCGTEGRKLCDMNIGGRPARL